jgi:hypothetical protein
MLSAVIIAAAFIVAPTSLHVDVRLRGSAIMASMADSAEAAVFDGAKESDIRQAVADVHIAADAFAHETSSFACKFTASLLAKKTVDAGSFGIIDDCLVDEGQVAPSRAHCFSN